MRIATSCRGLLRLGICECKQVTAEVVRFVANNCTKLQSLDIDSLDVDGASIGYIARRCPRLTELDITRTNLDNSALREIARSCGSLKQLFINGCDDIDDNTMIAAIRSLPQLETVGVCDCEGLGLPPEQLETNNPNELLAYLQRNREPLPAVKMLLLGRGEVGKTHLSKWLAGLVGPHHCEAVRTQGFGIRTYNAGRVFDNFDHKILVRMFDCGGQPEQYSTHRYFFEGTRNLYCLVVRADQTWDENRASYYLRMIRSYAGVVPVVLVVSRCVTSTDPVTHEPRKTVRRLVLPPTEELNKFQLPLIAVDGYDAWVGTKLDDVKVAIRRQIATLSGVVTEGYPHQFHKLYRSVLRMFKVQHDRTGKAMLVPYIPLGQFLSEHCVDCGEYDDTFKKKYLEILRNMGILMHLGHLSGFQDSELAKVVFNPKWVRKWAYRIITSHRVAEAKGVIMPLLLSDLLSDLQDLNERRLLVELMTGVETMFEYQVGQRQLGGGRWYFVPDRLAPESGRALTEHQTWSNEDCWATLHFGEFLDESVLLRTIGRHHANAKSTDLINRDRIVFTVDGFDVSVHADLNLRTITVAVRGGSDESQRRELRGRVVGWIEHVQEPERVRKSEESDLPTAGDYTYMHSIYELGKQNAAGFDDANTSWHQKWEMLMALSEQRQFQQLLARMPKTSGTFERYCRFAGINRSRARSRKESGAAVRHRKDL